MICVEGASLLGMREVVKNTHSGEETGSEVSGRASVQACKWASGRTGRATSGVRARGAGRGKGGGEFD